MSEKCCTGGDRARLPVFVTLLDCDCTPDMDNIREERSILDHGSEGQGSVYVW